MTTENRNLRDVNTVSSLQEEKERLERAIEQKENDIQHHFESAKETALSPVRTVQSFFGGGSDSASSSSYSKKSSALSNVPTKMALDAGVNFLINATLGSRLGMLRHIVTPFVTRKVADGVSSVNANVNLMAPVEGFLKWVIRMTDEEEEEQLLLPRRGETSGSMTIEHSPDYNYTPAADEPVIREFRDGDGNIEIHGSVNR